MAKINYYLNGDTIMVSIVFNRNRLRMSVDEHTARWNQASQVSGDAELDFKLQRLRTWVLTELRTQENNGQTLTTDSIRKSLSAYLGRKQVTTTATNRLEAFIPEFLLTAKTKKGKPYTDGTKVLYVQTLNEIKEFNSKSLKRLDFNTINEQMYDKFVRFMQDEGKIDTTIGRHIASLKHILNVAFDRGVSSCIEQKREYFKAFAEDSDQEVLSLAEIDALYQFEVTDPQQRYRRDMYVMTFFTGFRYSDWQSHRAENIVTQNGIRILRIATHKTGRVAHVPINAVVEEILKRHSKSVFPFPTDSDMNRTIHAITSQIDLFKSLRARSYTVRGKKVTETVARHEMISCHTARRSFCTNLKLAGMDDDTVMQMTAHATTSSFRRYVRIDSVKRALDAADHPFFSHGNQAVEK